MKVGLGSRRGVRTLGAVGAVMTVFILTTATAAAACPNANTAGPPTLKHMVQPAYNPGNITTCPPGTTTFINTSGQRRGDRSASYANEGTTFETIVKGNGIFLSFMTNSPSFTIYIKGGPAYNTYDYTGTPGNPAYRSDRGLHAPYNRGGNLPTIGHYLVCGQPAPPTTPTLTTSPTPSTGAAGSVILNDTATLSAGAAPGSITFNLYEGDCTGTPAYTQTVPVSGGGSYSTTNTGTAMFAGTWNWTASYFVDSDTDPLVQTPCGQETVQVTQGTPVLSTTVTLGGAAGPNVLNDTAALSGGAGPTGTVTFYLYPPSDPTCLGTASYIEKDPLSDGSATTTNTTPAPATGTWHWIATYNGDDNNNSVSSLCAEEPVTVTTASPPGTCQTSASLSTLVSGNDVIAYIPEGGWESTIPGIKVVSVEGNSITGTVVIPTGSDVINSCASNSFTGQTVCTANNNDVYVLKGTGLDPDVTNQPLIDGGSGSIVFSGGSATTADVSMDTADNKALIALSVGGVGGFQFLDLATDTFEQPFITQDPGGQISESALMDSVHQRILSAAEDNNFEVADVSASSTHPQFFEHSVALGTDEVLDSTAEDCSTGIAFAPAEFVGSTVSTSQVEIADLSNGVFTPGTAGTPGSWAAPEQVQTLTGSTLSAGPSGSAVAQGTHTGVIAGEFGSEDSTGNADSLTALALPTTAGDGSSAPAFSNWVSCKTGPDPAGNPFVIGDDPHTLAAYQSPNGDAMALLVNEGATEMVKVDLTQMLDSGTVPAAGNVCSRGTLPSSVETFIPLTPLT